MKIVEPYATLLDLSRSDGINLLKKIERFGRISHRSEDKQTETSWERFIQAVVIGHGDWSITEHEHVSVEFLVDRGITHEIVRHRLFSYTQESTRFVNYSKPGYEAKFVRPVEMGAGFEWDLTIDAIENAYVCGLTEKQVTPQIARSILPNALASKLIMTGNLRSWRHFFVMRTTKETHPQMKQVTIPLLQQFKESIPLIYDDIIPETRQAESMRLAR